MLPFLIFSRHTHIIAHFQGTKPRAAFSWQVNVQKLALASFLYVKALSSLHGCWCITWKILSESPGKQRVSHLGLSLQVRQALGVELRKRRHVGTSAVTKDSGLVCKAPKSIGKFLLNSIGFRLHLQRTTPRTWTPSRTSNGPRQRHNQFTGLIKVHWFFPKACIKSHRRESSNPGRSWQRFGMPVMRPHPNALAQSTLASQDAWRIFYS